MNDMLIIFVPGFYGVILIISNLQLAMPDSILYSSKNPDSIVLKYCLNGLQRFGQEIRSKNQCYRDIEQKINKIQRYKVLWKELKSYGTPFGQ